MTKKRYLDPNRCITPIMPTVLGEALAKLREITGETQDQMAKRYGFSSNRGLVAWESGYHGRRNERPLPAWLLLKMLDDFSPQEIINIHVKHEEARMTHCIRKFRHKLAIQNAAKKGTWV